MRKSRNIAIAIAALFLIAVGGAASATTITTNSYWYRSTSGDIAESCKEFKIASGTGVIEARCNSATSDDHISAIGTEYDADNAIYCPEKSDGTRPDIAWGTQSSTDGHLPETWQLARSTNGNDYLISAVCTPTGSSTNSTSTGGRSTLDLGDTTNGLRNSSGKLEKR